MANRGALRDILYALLGTTSDDQAFPSTTLNTLLQQAVDSLLADIQLANPHHLSKIVTLTAASATSRLYQFSAQAPAITDFARWLEVRYDDEDGLELTERRLEDLRGSGADHFALTGVDEAPTLQTSKDSTAGTPLFFRYAYWPAQMSSDSSTPDGIPLRFHDVVPLEALFAFGLGGEQRRPPELSLRWTDRRAQLLTHVGRRGVQPARTRLYGTEEL